MASYLEPREGKASRADVVDIDTGTEIDLTGDEPSIKVESISAVRWADVMPSVSVVIPTWNEEKNLPHVLPRVPDWVSEVLIVDGGSTDRTVEVARKLLPDVRVITHPRPGKGNAMATGFRAARGDIIAAIDADGSMDPMELHAFVGQLVAGAELVKGSRFAQGGGTLDMEWYRRLGNWGLVMLTRLLYGQSYSDLCYGYIAFWRRVLEPISPDVDGFDIEALINARALRHKLAIAEVPSFEARRIHGVSNLKTFRDGWKVLRTLIRERIRRLPSTEP